MVIAIHRETAGASVQNSAGDGAVLPLVPMAAQKEALVHVPFDAIKDGDVTFPLATAEDVTVDQHPTDLERPNPAANHVNDIYTLESANRASLDDEDEEDEEEEEEEEEEEDEPTSCPASTDSAAERSGLMAQLKILEAMLRQVEAHEQQRALPDSSMVPASASDIALTHLHSGDTIPSKRQRRPNPKYFDSEIEADFAAGSSHSKAFRTREAELSEPVDGDSSVQTLQSAGNAAACRGNDSRLAHTTFSSVFDRFSARPGSTHRARTAMAQKHRVFSIPDGRARPTDDADNFGHLNGLSIRELHDSYRATFGRETSVKDKQWLKRQIFLGSTKTKVSIVGKENPRELVTLPDNDAKTRLTQETKADVQQSALASIGVNGQSTCGVSLRDGQAASTALDSRRGHRKTLSLATLSPFRPSELQSSTEFRDDLSAIGEEDIGPLFKTKEILAGGGKRLRKPNRRYIDDEGDRNLGFCALGKRSMVNSYMISGNEQQSTPLSLSWRRDAEKMVDDFGDDALQANYTRALTRTRTSHRQRTKNCSTGMTHKDVGCTANSAKKDQLALNAKLDGNSAVRKVNFRLPADPGQQDKNGKEDKECTTVHQLMSRTAEDPVIGALQNAHEQVSYALPVLLDEPSEEYQALNSRFLCKPEDTASDLAVATVPTANGGVRRKHHRPWTLREVVSLVEGVARCGGGKWADIKKLAFSTVGYRTAVDLKDKWRNLLRASRAQLHPLKQGEMQHKKQFSASIPCHILTRVRDLSSLNNQIVPTASPVTSRSQHSNGRSGRAAGHRR